MGGVAIQRRPVLPFAVTVDEAGFGQVQVDGQDVSDKVDALRFECTHRGPTLTLFGPAAGTISGDAVVQVVADGDERQMVTNFLAQVDPDELDRRVLAGADSVDAPVGAAAYLAELEAILRGG